MNVKQLPKTELHRHLELSIRRSTIEELAPQFGFDLSKQGAYEHHFLITEQMADLGSVLHKFLDTQKLLGSEEILERIAYEACVDAYNLEGIRVLELRYAPTFVAMNHDHLSYDKIHSAFMKGIEKAERDVPIAVGMICILQRILSVDIGREVAHFAIENKDRFIGLDLADDEAGFDSKPFSDFFLKAKEAGLGITVHSGEANLPKSPWYPKDAIEYLGADRIGHGVQIYREPEMIEYVKQKGVTLEVCPSSNYFTNAVATIEEHPIRKLMEAGVKVTINTDDPGIFGIDLNHEYNLLHDKFNFTEEEFTKCNETALAASFINPEKIKAVWPK